MARTVVEQGRKINESFVDCESLRRREGFATWHTTAASAGTTPRSRTSSGAQSPLPTSKPSSCWLAPLTLRLAPRPTASGASWVPPSERRSFMRAGEAAQEQSEDEKREGDEA